MRRLVTVALLSGALGACEAGAPTAPAGDAGTGAVSLALGAQAPAGVSGVLAHIACGDTLVERYAPLEQEGLPDHVDADLAGHAFADAFAVVPAGTCTVEAWAMQDEATPAPCTSASKTVQVAAGQTAEVLLTLVCDPQPAGGVDVAVVIDQPPVIDALVVAPGLDVPACSAVAVRAEASDPDGDPLVVTFEIVGPEGGVWDASPKGDTVILVPETPGPYTVIATVSDGLASAVAKVALKVLDGPCP